MISEQIVVSELGMDIRRETAFPLAKGGASAGAGGSARDGDKSLAMSVERHLAELFKTMATSCRRQATIIASCARSNIR